MFCLKWFDRIVRVLLLLMKFCSMLSFLNVFLFVWLMIGIMLGSMVMFWVVCLNFGNCVFSVV